MNYIRVLVARWSRRDWLAVLVVALVAALLVGTTLLVVTTGEQTTELAAEFDSNVTVTGYNSPEAARNAADSDAVVLPLATVRNTDGESTTAVGVPAESHSRFGLPSPQRGPLGPVTSEETWTLNGTNTTKQLSVTPGSNSGILPETWVRVDAETIEATGAEAAVTLESSEGMTPAEGAPLVGVFAFFFGGASDMMAILWGAVAIAGVVVAVTIANVVRVVITDRKRTIRVARATGATPRRIRLALGARAGLLTGAGAIFGYAIGVIVPNVAVNIAIFLGLPTTLTLQVTPRIAFLLSGMLGIILGIGLLSGYLTGRSATTGTVVKHDEIPSDRAHGDGVPDPVGDRLQLTLLSPWTIVPATATLAAFAVIVLLIASLGGVGASITTEETTIVNTEAAHPVSSKVPEGYAAVLNESGIASSPEILLFGQFDGEPYLARGGDYKKFASVTGAEIRDGRAPTGPDEAIVGTHAADLLGLTPGDDLVVGGSTERGLARVSVVGVYRTGGIDDHQVFLSLPTARHLSTTSTGYVNVVRTNTAEIEESNTPVIVDIEAPSRAEPNGTLQVTAAVWNPTDNTQEFDVPLTLGTERIERTVSLPAGELTSVEFEPETPDRGQYLLAVGPSERPLTVGESIPANVIIPPEVPPDTAVQVRVGNESANATVTIANKTVSVDKDGKTWLQTPEVEDTYEIVIRSDGEPIRKRIQVTSAAEKTLVGTLDIDPSTPRIAVSPTARATLRNPWNRSVEAAVTVDGPGTEQTEAVQFGPGEETEVSVSLARRPAGEYAVSVAADDRVLQTATYRVEGDERLASALAAGGHYGGGGGLGNAIEYVVGNLSVLLTAMVGLTAVTVVGAMSAVLSRAVRARQRTLGIYRATGASPRRILWVIVGDATRIGSVSSVLALGIALVVVTAFDAVGLLTVFGVTLNPWPSVTVLGVVFLGGLLLTVLAAVVTRRSIARASVQTLLQQ